MVSVARGACEDLDTIASDDETFVDRSGVRSAASRIINKYMSISISREEGG